MIAWINWGLLTTCRDEETCSKNLTSYIRSPSPLLLILTSTYSLLYLAVFSVRTYYILDNLNGCLRIRDYFQHIGVEGRKLRYRTVSWGDVVSRMVDAQRTGRYKVAVKDFDEWGVCVRVNRHKDYMVAVMGRRDR